MLVLSSWQYVLNRFGPSFFLSLVFILNSTNTVKGLTQQLTLLAGEQRPKIECALKELLSYPC